MLFYKMYLNLILLYLVVRLVTFWFPNAFRTLSSLWFAIVTLWDCCFISYQASDEGQWTGVLPVGNERITSGQIPTDGHISGNVFSGIDGEISGAHSVHSGLKVVREVINKELDR